jgi:transposase
VPRKKRRSFTRDFKLSALKRMAETDNIHSLARELGIERKLLYCWRDAFAACGEAGLRRSGRPSGRDRAVDAVLAAVTEPHEPMAPDGRIPDARLPDGRLPDGRLPDGRIEELERKIGQQQLELDFFRAALRRVRDQQPMKGVPGGTTSSR